MKSKSNPRSETPALTISLGLYSQSDRASVWLCQQAEGLGPFYQGTEKKPHTVEKTIAGKTPYSTEVCKL